MIKVIILTISLIIITSPHIQSTAMVGSSQYSARKFSQSTNSLIDVIITSSGKTVFTSSFDGKLRKYLLNTTNVIFSTYQSYTIFNYSSPTQFEADVVQNQTLIICSSYNVTRVLYKNNDQYFILQDLFENGTKIYQNSLSKNGNVFVTINAQSNTTTIYEYNGTKFNKIQQINHTGRPDDVVILQPYIIVVGGFNTTIYNRNGSVYTINQTLSEINSWSVAISRDGIFLATGNSRGILNIYQFALGSYILYQSFVGSYAIYSIAFTGDGLNIFVGLENSTTILYTKQSNRFSFDQKFNYEKAEVYTVATGYNSQLLASGGYDAKLTLYYQCNIQNCESCSFINICQTCMNGYRNVYTRYCQLIPNTSDGLSTILIVIIIILALLVVAGVVIFILYKKKIICNPDKPEDSFVVSNGAITDSFLARTNQQPSKD